MNYACICAVVAAGSASPTKRHLHELQQTHKHDERGVEPERCPEAQEPDPQAKLCGWVPGPGELAEIVDRNGVGVGHGPSFYMEIHRVQEQSGI